MTFRRNLLTLSAGDFVAKGLSFFAFVHAARVLGVEQYGLVEFALAVNVYLILIGDAGLELWATRAASWGQDVPQLAGRVLPIRLALALVSYSLLLAATFLIPTGETLGLLLRILGLTLFPQAVNLKWVFMAREEMANVARGAVAAQALFAVSMLLALRSPQALLWIPILRLLSDCVLAAWFGILYFRRYPQPVLGMGLRESGEALRAAGVLGAAHALAQVSYNFDSVLLGLISGPAAVGLYGAAYRPITAVLAVPVAYFLGLFPRLSRTFQDSRAEFESIVNKSIRILAIFALPVGLGGVVWAGPVVDWIFGPDYAGAVPAVRILACSATLVILRGTCRQALNAAGRQDLDLRCAWIATSVNVTLNLLLIPHFNIAGAAAATLASEVIWLAMASTALSANVVRISVMSWLKTPLQAAACSALVVWWMQPVWWLYQAAAGAFAYAGMLTWLGEHRLVLGRAGKLQPSL